MNRFRNNLYYQFKPFLPVGLRMAVRRFFMRRKRARVASVWPIDPDAARPPAGWPGWPDGKKFAVVLTHDVESQRGLDNVRRLAELEMDLGFRSSFNFVPEGHYSVPMDLIHELKSNDFEVGVHGLKHDGKLFRTKRLFLQRAKRINHYLREWGAVGFRAPLMHHKLDWLHALDIQYDMSTFDTDPFEPQPDGTATIFPFQVGGQSVRRSVDEGGRSEVEDPRDGSHAILANETGRSLRDTDSQSSHHIMDREVSKIATASPDAHDTLHPPTHPTSAQTATPAPSHILSPISHIQPSCGYLELPYTLPQDSTLYLYLQEPDISIWTEKLDWIAAHGGMALLTTHPDYIDFDGSGHPNETYPISHYTQFLEYLQEHHADEYWLATPGEVVRYINSFQGAEGQRTEVRGQKSEVSVTVSEPLGRRECDSEWSAGFSPLQASLGPRATDIPGSPEDAKVEANLNDGEQNLNSGGYGSQASKDTPFPLATTAQENPTSDLRPLTSISQTPPTPDARQSTENSLAQKGHSHSSVLHPPSSQRRICMLAYTFYESDNRVMRYAETLVEQGDHVEVIALKDTDSRPAAEDYRGVRLFRIQKRVQNEKGPWNYFLRLLRFTNKASWILAQRHFRNRYDLIHVHNVPDFLVFAAWIPKLFGARVILDIHDIVPEFYASKFERTGATIRWLERIERWSAAFADHVIISNHLWLERFVARSAAREKCSVVLNHVDTRVFFPHPRTRSDDRLVVVFPGGLQWHQGIDIAIRAFARIADEIPRAEFHIYGEGNRKPELIALKDQCGLNGRIQFHPSVPIEQIAQVIADADLGVVPKRADSFGNEAYSTKIMEFMSQNVPVIVSRTRIDAHYFTDDTVTFFESGNEIDLAEKIHSLLADKSRAAAQCRHAQSYVAANNWNAKKHDYLTLVDKLTPEPAAKRGGG